MPDNKADISQCSVWQLVSVIVSDESSFNKDFTC